MRVSRFLVRQKVTDRIAIYLWYLCIYPSFMSNAIIQLFNDSLPLTASFC